SATPSIPADISPSPSPTPTGDPIKPRALSLSDTLSASGKIIPGHLKLRDTVSAQNRNVLVTTNATGARYKFNSLNQLPDVKAPLTFAVPEAYNTGNYGIALLKNVYKYQVPATKVANESTEREQLLAKDAVQVALLHSIDPSIEDNRFTMLEDPQSTQLNQQLVPLVRQSLPSSAQEAINRVSSTLDTGNLTFLLRLTSGTNPVAEDEAAKFWLDHPRK
ncbi:glycine betaine ABC transporter substrate-binding protein, partial [Rothia aeria]